MNKRGKFTVGCILLLLGVVATVAGRAETLPLTEGEAFFAGIWYWGVAVVALVAGSVMVCGNSQ